MGIPNYGLAIIFMTIAIKLLMFPLTQKQMHSMLAMQEIQPKAKYIQDKYKDDPQVMQQKVMELYKENGVSPFGGCLPLLIQMPIFIAFYQALFNFKFVNLAHAAFLWIPNIGKPDPYFILAILAAATTYYQQKLSMVDSKDPTQKTMLYFMPLFMAFIAYKLPAGLPLYWVVFNILGIIQQLYVNSQKKAPAVVSMGTAATAVETKENAKPSTSEKTGKTDKQNSSKNTNADKTDKQNQSKNADAGKAGGKTKAAGGDEGGKAKNASPNNRKKGKKR